ncbi:MAG: phosphatidate cytidylyltransferase [Oscillospiraceae bacterium]|nr:phosphatidate cytidylyltransferase [Oscillospiraceae bacterium]
MLTRILTGIVALLIFVPILFFSHTVIFDIAIATASFIGTIELLKCVGIMSKYAISAPSMLVSFLVPLLIRYVSNEAIMLIVIFYLFYLLYAAVFARKENSTNDIALCFFATVFVTISFTSIIITRELPYGDILYLMIFIGAWSTDTFAYFTGKIFGRHKLPLSIRDVSPNKTIEGIIGGIIFCAAAFVLYGFIVARVNIERFANAEPNYILLACAGIATSVIAILGDLSTSAIKRNYNVKDFGSIFPGHGGILDRFDSVMAVAPVIMIIGAIFLKFSGYGLFT